MCRTFRTVLAFALLLVPASPAFAARTNLSLQQPSVMDSEMPFSVGGQTAMTLDKNGLTIGGGLAVGSEAKGLYVDPASGNVGVGTRTPTAALDVAGDLRLGSAAHGAEVRVNGDCSVSGEGTMAYDRSAHRPVYCSDRLVWNEIGGQQHHAAVAVKTVMLDGLTCAAAVDRMNQAAGVHGGFKSPGSPQTLISNSGAWLLVRLTNDCVPMVRVGRDIGLIAVDADGKAVQGYFRE